MRQPEATWNETLARLSTDIGAARRRLDQAEQQLAHLTDTKAPIDEKLQLASEHSEQLGAEIERLETTIQREREFRRREARVPVTRVTHKRPAHIVLARSRMFIVDSCDWGLSMMVDASTRDVDLVPLPQDRTEIVLRAGGGTLIDENLAGTMRWRRFREVAPAQRYFLYLGVLPDAYDEFLLLRHLAVSAGYDYDVVPLSPDDPLVLSPASQLTTQ